MNADDFVKSGSQLSQFKDDLFNKAGAGLNTLTNFIMHDLFGKLNETYFVINYINLNGAKMF